MNSNSKSIPVPMRRIMNNASIGKYQPKFFELEEFNLSRVIFNSYFFEETDVEKEIVTNNFSFAYLREDKLRTIDAYTINNKKILFSEFLSRLGINIKSKNLFKTSKYLSRIFRPTKYGGFYGDLSIYINRNPELQNKRTDGISLISVELTRSLGWKSAFEGNSAQFTLFFKEGLVKGHCVVSSRIGNDIVIFEQNIKDEISFTKDVVYVAIEPVNLSSSVRMDIQSLLNLWNLFGDEQYFNWARNGIEKYKEDLVSGRLSEMLDNFDDIQPDDYNKESWTLRRAIWHKIDYTRFPGLIRIGWQMFRKSIINYADKNGMPVFRIPVPNAYRGYLRCDLKEHDEQGNFESTVPSGTVHLDKYGNIWINKDDINEYLNILGGADQDDSAVVIAIEDNKAVLYRNPNQSGEYLIVSFTHDPEIIITAANKIIGSVPQKKVTNTVEVKSAKLDTGNSLIDNFLQQLRGDEPHFLEFNQTNLLRTYSKISDNVASVGITANAEMIRSALGINDSETQNELTQKFCWNLERVIDSVVKDGVSCSQDLYAVNCMYDYLAEQNIELPKTLLNRLPEKRRDKFLIAKDHKLDQLLEAVKFLIKQAEKEVLGEGTASKNNRVPGLIDKCKVPLIEIGIANIANPMNEKGVSLLKNYNRQIAILLERTNDWPNDERENYRATEIEKILKQLLTELISHSAKERIQIVKAMAYNIYKSQSYIHDSILWISSKENLRGTVEDTIEMLSNLGIACRMKSNGSIERHYEPTLSPNPNSSSLSYKDSFPAKAKLITLSHV